VTKLSVHFVGTGAGAPTLQRGAPAILIRREGEGFLFDCGEATQLALRKQGLGFRGLKAVFVSHMHGDHVLGLPGLIMSLSLNANPSEIQVFGPVGIDGFLKQVFEKTCFEPKFTVRTTEIESTLKPLAIYSSKDYSILAVSADHTVPSLCYALIENPRPGEFNIEKAVSLGVPKGPLWGKLQRGEKVSVNDKTVFPEDVLGKPRKGRRIVYSGDTRPCDKILEMGVGADLFIHESTMPDDNIEEAWVGGHSTVTQALRILEKSGCTRGVLTNFGQKIVKEDLERILQGFPSVSFAFDGLTLDIPLP
jgi:ribonuclease Z